MIRPEYFADGAVHAAEAIRADLGHYVGTALGTAVCCNISTGICFVMMWDRKHISNSCDENFGPSR